MTFENPESDFSIDFHAVIKLYNVVNDIVYSNRQKMSSQHF